MSLSLHLPKLEYGLTRPHPRNRWFLFSTIILFVLMLPILIIVNSEKPLSCSYRHLVGANSI